MLEKVSRNWKGLSLLEIYLKTNYNIVCTVKRFYPLGFIKKNVDYCKIK